MAIVLGMEDIRDQINTSELLHDHDTNTKHSPVKDTLLAIGEDRSKSARDNLNLDRKSVV